MSNRQDKGRESELQPKRIEYAQEEITKLGYIIVGIDNTKIQFLHKGEWVTIYPYSGWHSGKSIKDGRGINNLLNQLEQQTV